VLWYRMRPYERFEAWQLAHQLFLAVQKEIKSWPPDERFAMVAQVRRSSLSVAANLVEGSAKRGPKEFRRFVDIAIGSMAETEYLLRAAKDLGYTSVDRWTQLDDLVSRAGRCLSGLARSLDGRGGGPPGRPAA
jgi:four helix bundle protein